MKPILFMAVSLAAAGATFAQDTVKRASNRIPVVYTVQSNAAATPVKSQGATGTCWCFSTTSLVESQCLKNKLGTYDLSEMFTVRNIYIEKAKNYVLRQGHAQFGEGGLGHDLIRAIATYGAVPETVYSGVKPDAKGYDHSTMAPALKQYLDSILKISPVPANWLNGYIALLDGTMGVPPAKFSYNGKEYTPKTFAAEAIKFNPDDYVNITSFTHHPYYQSFIIEVPDNFSNGSYYNLPLNEMISLAESILGKGYSLMWDADVSNNGFITKFGTALNLDGLKLEDKEMKNKVEMISNNPQEGAWNATRRQELFENLTTQDDHLMHITGLEKDKNGKTFFLVKNSWGDGGPYKGYINVSEAYFAINTISLVVPKAAIDKILLDKLKIK